MSSPHPLHPRILVAVLLGGAVGTALRLLIDWALPAAEAGFPWSTLVANTAGSFLLGMLVATVFRRPRPLWLRVGLGAGVLGAFTTFSAVALSVTTLGIGGSLPLAALYLLGTLLLGLTAALVGIRLGHPRLRIEVDE